MRSYWRVVLLTAIVFFASFSCLLGLLLLGIKVVPDDIVEYDHRMFDEAYTCSEQQSKQDGRTRAVDKNGKAKRKKVILFYTTIFGRVPVYHTDRLTCCEPFKCEVTTDKSKLLESDAVVFHGRDLPERREMPRRSSSSQRWIFYSQENPFNAKIVPEDYDNMFNWTMTYERRADIYEPYGYYTRKNYTEDHISENHAIAKDKLVVFVNSNCHTHQTIRENYIRALSKIIKVDVYGKCGGIFGRLGCPLYSERCAKWLRRYKFYIALENSICEDYLTEKYWRMTFNFNAVPIVYGTKSTAGLLIPGSYISASDFPDVESLSKYLLYLDKNNTAYNEYFSWRRFYQRTRLEPWLCRLCRMLHNTSLPVQIYKHFDKFLNPKAMCGKNMEHFKKYIYS